MSEAAMTVGATVARARADAGLTLAQVASATRVRATVLEAIEHDDFALCGGDVYARGHLKSIATAVGLDPTALAAQFDAERGRPREVSETVAPVEQPVRVSDLSTSGASLGALAGTLGTTVEAGRRGPNWSAMMALALAVVVGVGAISFLANRPSGNDVVAQPSSSPSTSAPAASPTTPSTSPTTEAPTTEPSTSASPSEVVAQADGVVVTLTVTGKKSWVRATSGPGGKTLYEGILSSGDTKTFRDKSEVSLVIGNAGAVSLEVNGRDLGAPGSGGQVVKATFGPGDPTTTTG